jgi:hypothetical protein
MRVPKVDLIRHSTDDHVTGHKFSISILPGTKLQEHHVGAIWFIMRRWV